MEKVKSYLRLGDLVKLNSNDSIGYVIYPCKTPPQMGDELKPQCCIRWIDGEYKNQSWISISTELREDNKCINNIVTLITDKKKIEWYKERYEFINSMSGTKNILSSDFPPEKQSIWTNISSLVRR